MFPFLPTPPEAMTRPRLPRLGAEARAAVRRFVAVASARFLSSPNADEAAFLAGYATRLAAMPDATRAALAAECAVAPTQLAAELAARGWFYAWAARGHVATRVEAPLDPADVTAWRRALLEVWPKRDWMHPFDATLAPLSLAGAGEAELAQALGDWARAERTFCARELFLQLFPRRFRHAVGEYDTPAWLARHVLRVAGWEPGMRLLDPYAGRGTFLTAAWELAAPHWQSLPAERGVRCVLETLMALELSPLAVLAARAQLLAVLPPEWTAPLLEAGVSNMLPADSLLAPPPLGVFACVVGNPPWVAWDHVPPDLRRALAPMWERYGLFSATGMEAILGGAKKDLAALAAYAASERYLAPGGTLAFLMPRLVLKAAGAASSFRRFALGPDESDALGVQGAEDWLQWPLFEGAATTTTLLVWRRGEATRYPVPLIERRRGEEVRRLLARPIRSAEPTSAWLCLAAEEDKRLLRLSAPSGYRAYEGVNTGGANGIYWMDRLAEGPEIWRMRNKPDVGKRALAMWEGELEARYLYPLVRYRDVRAFAAAASATVLLVQDPLRRRGIERNALQSAAPRVHAYLLHYETELRARSAFRRYFCQEGRERAPWYSMFNVSEKSLAPIKVVFKRLGSALDAAVLVSEEKPILPQETLCFVPCADEEEAHYLAGMLNSPPFTRLLNARSLQGGKGFAGPHVLETGAIPRYDGRHPAHRAVADRARAAADQAELGACHPDAVAWEADAWAVWEATSKP